MAMDHLDKLESKSIYIIREAYNKFRNIGALWSVGKDSVLGDSRLYYKINGKLKWGTIEELYNEITPNKSYKKGSKEFLVPKEKVEVLTVKGKEQKKSVVKFGKVTHLITHPTDKDVYDVELQTKRHIQVTGDHGLIGACSSTNGLGLKEMEVRNLTKKDSIFCLNTFNFDHKELKKWGNIKVEDWLLVLGGLWLADGCYAVDRKIIISSGDNRGIKEFLKNIPRMHTATEKIAKDLQKHPDFNGESLKMDLARELSEKYGVSFWSAYDSKKRMKDLLKREKNLYARINENGDVWLCSKELVNKMKKLGFEGRGEEKKIPKWIFEASNRQIALFLSGYFAGDGSCWKKDKKFEINISGMNKNLIDGLRPLLLRLGINHGLSETNAKKSGFRTKNKKMYQITISSVQGLENFLKSVPDLSGKLKKIKISWKGKSNYQISARKVKSIKKLPKSRRIVYDIEVENTHNFIVNEILCHNSTVLLHLVKKSFFGKVPFPVVYIDTGYHFQEMYDFRDKLVKEWKLDLVVSRNREADEKGIGPKDKFDCCNMRKTEALKKTIKERGFDALLLGIRRDEHGIRAKERYYSPRDESFQWDYENQPPEMWDQYKTKSDEKTHLRIHPILHWTELDVWRYVKRENLPVNPLYFARNGKRYRSLGCETCTSPVESDIRNLDDMIQEIRESKTAERAGRSQDKEKIMQRLRALGYM